jgi:hypothetical protein
LSSTDFEEIHLQQEMKSIIISKTWRSISPFIEPGLIRECFPEVNMARRLDGLHIDSSGRLTAVITGINRLETREE